MKPFFESRISKRSRINIDKIAFTDMKIAVFGSVRESILFNSQMLL
jgi:hypothetical protein